jgi:hypothetical protein
VRSPHFTVASNAGEKKRDALLINSSRFGRFFTLRWRTCEWIQRSRNHLAGKNEATMKALLPEDWEVKGRVHPAGLYQPGEDKHYVVLGVDSEGG